MLSLFGEKETLQHKRDSEIDTSDVLKSTVKSTKKGSYGLIKRLTPTDVARAGKFTKSRLWTTKPNTE